MEAMSDKTSREEMAKFVDDLLDDLMATPDDVLRLEAIEDYGSVAAAIRGIGDEINVAINSLAKDRLFEVRAGLARAKKDADRSQVSPETRKRVAEMLSSNREKIRMTLAARKDQGASERDILSACTDLCELHGNTNRVPRPNFGSLPKAEFILKELGITSPD